MHRREFLATSALLLGGSLQAAAPTMTFGFSLYGMKSLKTEDALRTLVKIGFDSAELCLLPGYDAEPKNLSRERCKAIAGIPIRITAIMENLSLADAKQESQQERLKLACAVAQRFAPVPIVETVLGNGEWDQIKIAFRDRLAAWAKIAGDAKVILAIKPHRFGAVNRPDQALWLLEQIDSEWVKLAFDWSHFVHRDFDFAKTVAQLAPKSVFVHIKDTIIVNGKAEFRLPGDTGQIDYPQLLKALTTAGYRGDVCCEVSGMVSGKPDYDPVKAAQRCYNNLAAAFGRGK